MSPEKYVPHEYDEEVTEAQIPDGIRFDVPRINQGQMVEVAYGGFGAAECGPGDPYKRVYDSSDGSVRYFKRTKVGGWQ